MTKSGEEGFPRVGGGTGNQTEPPLTNANGSEPFLVGAIFQNIGDKRAAAC